MNKSILIIGIIAVAVFGFFLFTSGGGPAGPGEYDDFAKCLSEAGLTMYGTQWCSHCQNQKEDFGSSFQYIDFVDCDKQSALCDEKGVSGYPTWKFNGQSLRGEQNLQYLADITSCELQKSN